MQNTSKTACQRLGQSAALNTWHVNVQRVSVNVKSVSQSEPCVPEMADYTVTMKTPNVRVKMFSYYARNSWIFFPRLARSVAT